ncbi:hypothetical protein EC968_001155 [Mortierella alpina]|nr:hypothetical protein EC968_001155 [Mortierella alpina]
MITVPPQEIASFLGNHLDRVLEQTGREFLQSVAASRQFRAGCALMDVLNAVESVQERIRTVLQERDRSRSQGDIESEPLKVRITTLYLLYSLYSGLPIHQHPFLCLFVDIYSTTLQDEQQKPERFVVSVILNGDGEELAPSKPSELITIAREADSRPVDLQSLDDVIPDVPIEDQVPLGLGWENSDQRRGDRKAFWESLKDLMEDLHGSDSAIPKDETAKRTEQETTEQQPADDSATNDSESHQAEEGDAGDGEELEEWEIEAEKHFQGSEDVAPAPAVVASKPKKKADNSFNRQQLNFIMEQAVIQPLSFDQEQFMLAQFTGDAAKVHIPLPPHEALPGIVDNNPMIAFNLLLHLIQLSSELEGTNTDTVGSSQKTGGSKDRIGKAGQKSSGANSPAPTIVDGYLDTMTHAKRLTLHSLEVVNRLTGATTLSPRFLHAYIENAVRCCEMVEDKVGQARVVRMLCVFLQSLLRNEAITIAGYYHALQNFCVQFSRVKEVANLFQSLVEYQRKMDAPSPVRVAGPSQQGQQQQSRPLTQSASMPSTPTTDTPQRSSWLANSGSISHVKTSLNKHNSLNGFSAPGALSQFIHPGSPSPSSTGGGTHQNGTLSSSTNGNGAYFKTHNKNSSQHSSASGSLFSSPTVMSASVNAFNTGLGNPTSLTLNGINNSNNNNHGSNGGSSAHGQGYGHLNAHRSGSVSASGSDYDLDAAIRASLRDMEDHAGSSSSPGSRGPGSGASSSTNRTPTNGLLQQQQQQTVHLGPKGINSASHLGNHSRGPGARRGG